MTYLDLIQIYNLQSDRDLNDIEAIFADIDIDERIDKTILAGTILDECGAMNCIYTTSPTFKFMSDNFFARNKESISRIMDTLEIKYSPLESINFGWTEKTDIKQDLDTTEDITEDRTKTNTGTTTTNTTGTTTTTETGSTTTDETGSVDTANTGTQNTTGSLTEENTISAMNDSNYQPDSHKTSSSTNNRTDDLLEHTEKDLETVKNENLTKEQEDSLTEEQVDDRSEQINANNNRVKNEGLVWNETDTHNEKGSKGFAYQDLINKELKIRNFSIYSWIAKKYAKEMFLLVY